MSRQSRSAWFFVVGSSLLVASAAVAQNKAANQLDKNRTVQKRQIQQPDRQQPNVVTTRKVPAQANSHADSQIAACLIIENNNEVALGQYASQKAQNPEVKDFAQRVANDHQQFAEQLHKFASAGGHDIRHSAKSEKGEKNAEQPRNRRDKEDRTAEQPEARRTEGAEAQRSDTTASTDGKGLDFIQIKQEIADKCLASAKHELDEKQADKFDKCYIGGQVMAHMAMVDAMEVLKNHASGELSPVLEDGLKTAQAHLEDAKRIAKSLESNQQK